ISESVVGRAVASTRQCAGRIVAVCCGPGGAYGPAATSSADLIVTVGIVSAARLAQGVPPAAAGVPTWAMSGMAAVRSAARMRRTMNPPRGRFYFVSAKRSRRQHDLADHFTLRHLGERLGGALERKHLRDVRLEPAFGVPGAELPDRFGESFRLTSR